MKKLSIIVAVALLLVLAGAMPVAAQAPDEVWVCPTGDCGHGADGFNSVQAAIDAVAENGTVSVYPGTYYTGISKTGVDPATGGSGGNSFIIFVGKAGVKIRGVDASGDPVASYDSVAANIVATEAAPSFGSSTLFVQADDVEIVGLEITAHESSANKTIEVIGDNVRIAHCKINTFGAGAIYINDFRFNETTSTSHVQSYLIDGNYLNSGAIALASGAGYSGSVDNRIIRNNLIKDLALSAYDLYGIGFRGANSEVAWYVYPVGAAQITGNRFENGKPRGYVYADGEGYASLDWNAILAGNTFDRAVVVYEDGTTDVRADSLVTGAPNRRRIGTSI